MPFGVFAVTLLLDIVQQRTHKNVLLIYYHIFTSSNLRQYLLLLHSYARHFTYKYSAPKCNVPFMESVRMESVQFGIGVINYVEAP